MKTDRYPLTESTEMYLKAIYQIVLEKKAARAKDISKFLGVNSSSVTNALRHLAAQNYINYEPYDLITLTDEGVKVADAIVHRGEAIRKFLTDVLGIESEEAEECACRMEHTVTPQVWMRMDALMRFMKNYRPGDREQRRKEFFRYLKHEGL